MQIVPKVSPTENPREWVLLEDLYFLNVIVPKGFIFDGASIPIGLRWLFPHGGKKFGPACIHDYLYRNGLGTKEDADHLFRVGLIVNGVSVKKANLFYYAVKVFGGFAWKG